MATEYTTIREWAANKVSDPVARAIRRDINRTFGNPHDKKGQARWQTIYRVFSGYDNLPNGLNSLKVGDRVRADQLHACWLCGTPHSDGYVCSPATSGIAGRDPFIGHNCAERLTGYGLRAGVLTEADRKTRAKKTNAIIAGIDGLVLNDGDVLPLMLESSRPNATESGMLGHHLGWIGKHYKDFSPEVQQAYDRLTKDYVFPEVEDVRTVFRAIEYDRPFPASTYKNILSDVRRMEKAGKADEGIAKRLQNAGRKGKLTGRQVKAILGFTDHRGYRIFENEKRLRRLDAKIGDVMNTLAPLAEHDKPLWGRDITRQRYTLNKVLSEADYRTVAGSFNRWRFGYTSEVHGSDARTLRERAIRLESVVGFQKKIDGMVAVQRKFEFAKDQTAGKVHKDLGEIIKMIEGLPKTTEKKKSKAFREAVHEAQRLRRDPLVKLQAPAVPIEVFGDYTGRKFQEYKNLDFHKVVALVGRKILTPDRKLSTFQESVLPQIVEHAKYGFILKSDAKKLEQAFVRRKKVTAV